MKYKNSMHERERKESRDYHTQVTMTTVSLDDFHTAQQMNEIQ
jgi:hypothetical protein